MLLFSSLSLSLGNNVSSCEELISMLITLKVIILYIIQVIISMQTSVKMGII